MASSLKTLVRWARSPARDVDSASGSWVNTVRGLASRATTPLLPDDYLSLLNPLWSARELRGEIVSVKPETEDSATVVIRPGWGFSGDYSPGQYVGIGLRVDGRWHWRSYSLTSVPERGDENISITVKATPEGFLSAHLVNGVEPGTIIRLASPKGDFALPNPPRRDFCSSLPAVASHPSWRCCVRCGPEVSFPTSFMCTRPDRRMR